MKVTTPNSEERIARFESFLMIDMGGYLYGGWFIHYNLLRYDIILGKDWMATRHHLVDHQRNILHLGRQKTGWLYSVIGLPSNYRRVKDLESCTSFAVTSTCEKNDAAIAKVLGGALTEELNDLVTRFRELFQEPEGLPPNHRGVTNLTKQDRFHMTNSY